METSTFLAGLRRCAITAPFVFEGSINGEIFRTYIADVLVPTVRPGDIVVMDNLGSHKGRAIRDLVRKAGARVWFLPPYSPDLNPIEQVRSSPSSNTRSERLRSATGSASASCSMLSHLKSAPTTASTQATASMKTDSALE